jgi:pSer/pThr/pTyr-binding forkhead associated (FHA) protein
MRHSRKVMSMKLLFPNGEHEPVELKDGDVVVGSAPDAQVMIAAPGIGMRHCILRTRGEQTTIRALDQQATTVLNGKQITVDTPLKPGDLVLFAKVGCRVVAVEKAATVAPVRKPAPAPTGDDDGRTRVRMALPKFMIRGVSGPTFGKTYAVVGSMTIGRNSDCDIPIATDEISRHHAKLQVVPTGVMVEDLGSANGTFVNNQRVHGSTLMKANDELRLDTVRFLLVSPTAEAHSTASAQPPAPAVAPSKGGTGLLWIIAAAVVLGVIVLGVLRYLGKI